MSLLPLAKTWQIDRNIDILNAGGGSVQGKRQKLHLVDSLIGFATNAPTVAGSSDGTAGGMDAVNRWVNEAALINSTGFPRSWIVLEFAAGGQILFDLFEANDRYAYYSPAGLYTGGDHNALPTATDQITLWTNRSSGMYTGGNDVSTLHVWLSTDGNSVRYIVGRDGGPASLTILDMDLAEPVAGWATLPNFFGKAGSGSSSAAYRAGSDEWDATNVSSAYDIDGTGLVGQAYLAGGAFQNQGYSDQIGAANAKSGEFQLAKIRMQSEFGGDVGAHGRPADMWWGMLARNGSVYEESGSFFAQFDQIVLPWPDNVAPTM